MKKSTPNSPAIYQIVFLVRKSKKENLTATELRVLREWLDQDPRNLEMYERLQRDDRQDAVNDMLTKDAWGRYAQITGRGRTRHGVRWVAYGSFVAAAAVAVYFLFTPLISEQKDDIQPLDGLSDVVTLSTGHFREGLVVKEDSVYEVSSLLQDADNHKDIAKVQQHPVVISTPVGKTIAFKLYDGSTVYLNSNSSISFHNRVNTDNERRVQLDGEAFFIVSRDETRPFIVESGGNEVKVLGTSFNVNGHESRSKFKLGLATGKVEVTIKEIGYSETLRPGEEVTYDKDRLKVVQTTKDVDRIGLWRRGIYVFEDMSIQELTKDMEQMYPIHFKYEGEMPGYLFNGEISRSDDWKKVLSKLELTNRVRFTIAGNEVTVRSHGGNGAK